MLLERMMMDATPELRELVNPRGTQKSLVQSVAENRRTEKQYQCCLPSNYRFFLCIKPDEFADAIHNVNP